MRCLPLRRDARESGSLHASMSLNALRASFRCGRSTGNVARRMPDMQGSGWGVAEGRRGEKSGLGWAARRFARHRAAGPRGKVREVWEVRRQAAVEKKKGLA